MNPGLGFLDAESISLSRVSITPVFSARSVGWDGLLNYPTESIVLAISMRRNQRNKSAGGGQWDMSPRTPKSSPEEEWIRVVKIARNTLYQIFPDYHGIVRFEDGTATRFVSNEELEAESDYRIIYEYTEGPFGSPILNVRNILERR